jgi:hypothetical protein
MPVITMPTKDGPVTMIVCGGPKPKRCEFCANADVAKLCDFPVGPRKACSAGMCHKCATLIAVRHGETVDYCPRHKGKTPPQAELFNDEAVRP